MKSANAKGTNPLTQLPGQQTMFLQQQQTPFTQLQRHAQTSLASPAAQQ